MKKRIALVLLIAALVALTGCAPAASGGPPATATPTPLPSPPASAPVSPEPLWFQAHYMRIGGTNEAVGVLSSAAIVSVDELSAYYQARGDLYEFAVRGAAVAGMPSVGFIEDSVTFDDAFFDRYALVFLEIGESSGSYRHVVRSVSRDEDGLRIDIDRYTGMGTDDMAHWYIVLRIERSDFDGEAIRAELKTIELADGQSYPW